MIELEQNVSSSSSSAFNASRMAFNSSFPSNSIFCCAKSTFENGSNGTEHHPAAPTHGPSEYITIAYQATFFLIGLPLNLLALRKLLTTTASKREIERFALYKLHLTITDIMTLLFYTISEVTWISTFSWYGGDFLCKLTKFLQLMSFVVHSNVVTIIGLDRLFVVLQMRNPSTKMNSKLRGHVMLAVSWTLGIACSIPQFFVWKVESPFPNFPQCSTVWSFEEHWTGSKSPFSTSLETIYNVSHLLVVFWIPAAIMLSCYAYVFVTLLRYSKQQKKLHNGNNNQKASGITVAPEIKIEDAELLSTFDPPSNSHTPITTRSQALNAAASFFLTPHFQQQHASATTSQNRRKSSITTAREMAKLIWSPTSNATKSTAIVTDPSSATSEQPAADEPISQRYEQMSAVAKLAFALRSTSKQSTASTTSMPNTARFARHFRSRTLRQTIVIVLAYILCWSPYNVLALWKQIAIEDWANRGYDEYLGFLYGPIILNAVIDPLLYHVGTV